MTNFLTSFFVTCLVLVSFIGGLRYCSLQQQGVDAVGVKVENRRKATIPVRQEDVDSGFPFVTEVRILYESEDKLVCEVDYYVHKNDQIQYGISLYPSKANFYSDKNVLKRGKNTQRISIRFSPKSTMHRRDQTSYLQLKIHENVDGNYMSTVYRRKLIFDKVWLRTQKYVPYLNPAEARTN